MLARRKRIIFSLVVFLLLVIYQNIAGLNVSVEEKSVSSRQEQEIPQTITEEAKVLRVVDGDTIEVLLNSKKEKVRVIGIDAPETVDPRRPVECFGREAANFAAEFLAGETIILKTDPTQDKVDVYGRLLRYVFVNDGVDFGKLMIEQGFAHEYTYEIPYKYREEYKNAENSARNAQNGLWKDDSCIK